MEDYTWIWVVIHGHSWLWEVVHGYSWLWEVVHGYSCMAMGGCKDSYIRRRLILLGCTHVGIEVELKVRKVSYPMRCAQENKVRIQISYELTGLWRDRTVVIHTHIQPTVQPSTTTR